MPCREEMHARFWVYVHAHLYSGRVNFPSVKQTTGIQNLDTSSYLDEKIAYPPLEEQRAIADYLDRETAKIEALVEKKRKLLELLEEKRLAVITQAVTKGLDPGVPMKESGIGWLGTMPAHWVSNKVRRCLISLRDGTHNPPPRTDGEYRLLSARNIVDGRFVTRSDDRTMDVDAYKELLRSYSVETGDVVVAAVGATTGKSAVVGPEIRNCSVQRSIAILRPDALLVRSEFLNYWIMARIFQSHLSSLLIKYAAQGGIYLEELGAMPMILPPLREQDAIVAFLNKASVLNIMVSKQIAHAVELLTEYRAALVTNAVSGKIRVA